MRVLLSGQKSFGAAVLRALAGDGHDICAVFSPRERGGDDERAKWDDPLRAAAIELGIGWLDASVLRAENVPAGTDIIVAAHSHAFVGASTRNATKYGAVGYHPSLLPLHRGRDAVKWAIRMRDRVTGGTVYWLTNGVDAGPIAAQQVCFVRPRDTHAELWSRDLFPIGVRLLRRVLADVAAGRIVRVPQIEECATWEPSIGRQPLFRPELPQLPASSGGGVSYSVDAAELHHLNQ